MAATAVAFAVVIAAIVCYLVVRSQLLGQVDSALRAQAVAVQQEGQFALGQPLPGVPPSAGGTTQYYQIVAQDGSHRGDYPLPVSPQVAAVANGTGVSFLTDVTVGNSRFRELIFPNPVTAPTMCRSPARSSWPARSTASTASCETCAWSCCSCAPAGSRSRPRSDGWPRGRCSLRLAEVAETAQHIEETEDLSSRIRRPRR